MRAPTVQFSRSIGAWDERALHRGHDLLAFHLAIGPHNGKAQWHHPYDSCHVLFPDAVLGEQEPVILEVLEVQSGS
jgi:hypothetical protein